MKKIIIFIMLCVATFANAQQEKILSNSLSAILSDTYEMYVHSEITLKSGFYVTTYSTEYDIKEGILICKNSLSWFDDYKTQRGWTIDRSDSNNICVEASYYVTVNDDEFYVIYMVFDNAITISIKKEN